MKTNAIFSIFLILIVASIGFFTSGCDEGYSSQTSVPVETGHEGHNHAPGEHGKAAPAVEPGHEGHDHGPGEHGLVSDEHETEELDWCGEHFVPESACTKCNPALIAQFKESGDWCAGHDVPESQCRPCNPGLQFPQEMILQERELEEAAHAVEVSLFFRPNASVCATNDALIQFASAQTVSRCGISTVQTRSALLETAIEAPAEVVFDESKTTVITSTVPGLVSRWMVSPGDVVSAGEPLAKVQSPEVARLQATLLAAHASYTAEKNELMRSEKLRANSLISDSEFERQASRSEQAKSEFQSAHGLLLAAGVAQSDIEELLNTGTISNQFILRASGAGVVVDRIAQIGELLDAGRAFAVLADPSAMWIEARLSEEQIRQVSPGQMLTFATDGRGQARVGGEIIWVSRFLDQHSRTGTVRARVIDPYHGLHAGEFGRASIIGREDRSIVLVDKDAVQWEGCCNVVFVKETIDRYRPRKVEIIDGEGPYYQVVNGLNAGEEVVVDGSFLLKTELKKSSIGAGCCGLEPTS
ncbi:MAG: efflux RND transporter periplasmic adaptor subunit [Candidatus Zixiibacteriota bacterium]